MATSKTSSTSSIASSPCSSQSSLSAVPTGSVEYHSAHESASQRGTDGIDWKERCQTLESSLHRFKQQATRIRELLSAKMKDLENRTQDAERKAEEAENRYKEMESQSPAGSLDSPPSDIRKGLHSLETQCAEKDKIIQQLQETLGAQKHLRLDDAKKIEEKSCRIKDWVAKKLKNLECENSELKMENDTLYQQVEALRTRLQLLPVNTAREIHRLSVQEVDGDFPQLGPPPPVPKRPDSSLLESLRMEHQFAGLAASGQQLYQEQQQEHPFPVTEQDISPDSDENMVLNTEDFEPDYQEVDDNHQSKYEPKKSSSTKKSKKKSANVGFGPPQVRIERRAFPKYETRSSTRSSIGGAGDDFFLGSSANNHTKTAKSPPLFKALPRNVQSNSDSNSSSPSKGKKKGGIKNSTRGTPPSISENPTWNNNNSFESTTSGASFMSKSPHKTNKKAIENKDAALFMDMIKGSDEAKILNISGSSSTCSYKNKTVAESDGIAPSPKKLNVLNKQGGVRDVIIGRESPTSRSETPEYEEPPPPSPTTTPKKKRSGGNTKQQTIITHNIYHQQNYQYVKNIDGYDTMSSMASSQDNNNAPGGGSHFRNYDTMSSNASRDTNNLERMSPAPEPEEPAYATPPPPHHPYTEITYNNRNIPAFATLPRSRMKNPLIPGGGGGGDNHQHYNEDADSPRHLATLSRSFSERRHDYHNPPNKPPTPPLRRMPSWENRIYDIANAGIQVPDTGNLSLLQRYSGPAVTEGLYAAESIYKDLSVPVYTTLKGKATRIRSIPFTGDSSSDSDDECGEDDDDFIRVNVGGHRAPHHHEAVVSVAGPAAAGSAGGPGGGGGVKVRKHVNHTSSGATKRGVSSHSMNSESSSDYAVPPDEVSGLNDSSGDSEPEHKLLKYTQTHSTKDSLERSGYLTKLGGKVKDWRYRWFVVKGGDLLYYKTPNDVARKPKGYISLDSHSKVVKTEGANTFQIITVKKTYYLTAESVEDMDQWIRVIQNVLKKQAADQVFLQTRGQEAVKGWVIKTKHGRSRRCYAVVIGKYFMYYKTIDDNTPLGQLSLQGSRVEEVDRSCDTESDSDDTTLPDYTLAIWPPEGQGPTYLMIPTKHEKESWLYHLTVSCGGNCGGVGTDYQQLLSKLLEVDSEPNCVLWKHPLLLHTKELLTRPLTTLPSEGLQIRALELFKSCQLFFNMAIESSQIDYHVTLAQNILNTCLQIRELQNELYCQLVKQTSPHPSQQKSAVQNLLLCGSQSWFLCSDNSPTSPENSVVETSLTGDSKLNPSHTVFLQGWQLLAMATSLFLPSQSVLWYLKAHIQRHADPRNEIGKYAVFCQRALERTKLCGPREARPSRMEVLSILLRNPYHHSQPISIPVHFLNATYQVVSFDGSTTVDEFLQTLNKTIGMRDSVQSGFTLFTDDPAGQKLEHCLRGHLKICDVISKWEQAFLHHSTQRSGKVDLNHTVKFLYKNRLYYHSQVRKETEKERLLLSYQVNTEIIEGRFPLNRDLAIELAALVAQIEYGDLRGPEDSLHRGSPSRKANKSGGGDVITRIPLFKASTASATPAQYSVQYIHTVLEKYYPKRYKDGSPSKSKKIEQKLKDKWYALRGRTCQECVRIYLTVTRKWCFFGAKLFSAKVKFGEAGTDQVWLAVQEESTSILDYVSLKTISTFDYSDVVTFGGCREDFMLVVNHTKMEKNENRLLEHKTERLLFTLSKPKMLELTLLMANYINVKRQHQQQQQQQKPYYTHSLPNPKHKLRIQHMHGDQPQETHHGEEPWLYQHNTTTATIESSTGTSTSPKHQQSRSPSSRAGGAAHMYISNSIQV